MSVRSYQNGNWSVWTNGDGVSSYRWLCFPVPRWIFDRYAWKR